MEERDYKQENKRLLLENATVLEENTQLKKNQEYMDEIIKERNLLYGIISELWDRLNRYMVRRE